MTIQRTTAKRQVASARALLVVLQTQALQPAHAETDGAPMAELAERLSTTTEDLARETYQPAALDKP